jgi:Xaa-Pro aminopeptidase
MIKTKEFTERRNKLFKEIEDNSVVVMYAGVAKKYSEDETLPYTANRNFYYLTNIEQEGSIYLLAKCDGILKEFLFISEYNEVNEKWTGKRLTSDEASKLSGIENVLGLDIFSAKLDMFISGKDKTYGFYTHLYLDLDSELKIGDDLYTVQLANSLSLNYTNIEIRNVYPILMKLRMVKSPQEIEEFKEAISKTNIGLKKIMMSLKPGMFEYQISSLFYYTIQSYDYSTLSFSYNLCKWCSCNCFTLSNTCRKN